MRIAVPVSNDRTAETLSGIEGFQFFEDDHGRIVRRFFVPRAGEGAAAAVAQLEPYGVDALVCGALPETSGSRPPPRASCSSPPSPARRRKRRSPFWAARSPATRTTNATPAAFSPPAR